MKVHQDLKRRAAVMKKYVVSFNALTSLEDHVVYQLLLNRNFVFFPKAT